VKPTGDRWWLRNDEELSNFCEEVRNRWKVSDRKQDRVCVAFVASPRTVDQNTMFYALYRDIANQRQDMSIVDVRADCKLRYGVVIRKAADPEWARDYDRLIRPLDMQTKQLLMREYPITREFTVAQGIEYIESILQDYTQQGYALADPRQMNGR